MIMNTTTLSRRSALAGLSAAAAAAAGITPVIAGAAGADPIFAMIKAEREAYAAYLATGEVQSRINDQNPDPIVVKSGAIPRKRRKTAAVKAWWAEYKKAEDAHTKSTQELWSAREAFLRTRPTTVAGLRAFLDHIDGPFTDREAGEAFWDDVERELAFPTLAAAVRTLIGGQS